MVSVMIGACPQYIHKGSFCGNEYLHAGKGFHEHLRASDTARVGGDNGNGVVTVRRHDLDVHVCVCVCVSE